MDNILSIINYAFILLYGIILSFSFVGALTSKRDKKILLAVFIIFGITELIFYFLFGQNVLYKLYPFIAHIPLILFLVFFMKKPPLLTLISVLSAYLLCTPRKWIGTFFASFFNYSQDASYIVQIIITIPLLYLICRYIAPHIASLKNEPENVRAIFAVVPSLYYITEYAITIYSKIFFRYSITVAEFLDSIIVILYFLFSILFISQINRWKEVKMDLKINTIKSEQAEKEIEQLKKMQEQSVIYRHDLLHHLNYISSCIESEKTQDALSYIDEICTDIHYQKVETYCENNAINLIIASYIAKAKKANIKVNFDLQIPAEVRIPITDLCIILANAMDNAIHACEKIQQSDKRSIYIAARMQKNKLFFKIENSFEGTIEFEDNLPKAKEYGHGIGTRSIALVVNKHNGNFSFEAKNNIFTVIIAV
jgi:signal transduction histidine kinase